MAKSFSKRERHKNLEAVRRLKRRKYYWGYYRFLANESQSGHDDWVGQDSKRQDDLAWLKRHLEKSVHRGRCRFSRSFFHPIWRNAGKKICQLHMLGETAQADDLDPQPKRLGIMWYID
jgi:hypothetical protein